MGNTLPEPRRVKESEEGGFGERFTFGLSDMQGWRLTMEDAYTVAPDLSPSLQDTHFVGVFDGHGGSEVAKFCAAHYHHELINLEAFKAGNYEVALKQCFHIMDNLLRKPDYFREIADYRAATIIHQFEVISEVIISQKSNRFTLTQLQEVLNQANYYSVPLTINAELISALEKLYKNSADANGPQGNSNTANNQEQTAPSQEPQPPVAPERKKERKQSRLGKIFGGKSKEDKGKKKSSRKERRSKKESQSNLSDDDWDIEDNPKEKPQEKTPKTKGAFVLDAPTPATKPPGKSKPLPPGMSVPPGMNTGAPAKQNSPPLPPGLGPKSNVTKNPTVLEEDGWGTPAAKDSNVNDPEPIEQDDPAKHTSVIELEAGEKKEVLPAGTLIRSSLKIIRASSLTASRPPGLGGPTKASPDEDAVSEDGADSDDEGFHGMAAADAEEEGALADDTEHSPGRKKVRRKVKNKVKKKTRVSGLHEDAVEADDVVEDNMDEEAADEEPVQEEDKKEEQIHEEESTPDQKKETKKPKKKAEEPVQAAPPAADGGHTFITAAGCTAIGALFHGNMIYVANIGDSRSVMSRAGVAIPLSEDHKPSNPKEKARIYAAGGTINDQGRINGDLNLSRCVGDLRFKTQEQLSPEEQIVTAEADVKRFEMKESDQFVVFACDGVWDVMTNQEVVDFVIRELQTGERSLMRISEKLLDECVSPDLFQTKGLGGDNLTCVIIALKPVEELKKFRVRVRKPF